HVVLAGPAGDLPRHQPWPQAGDQALRTDVGAYTQALISAIPVVEPGAERDVIILQGEPPSSFSPPSGCHFHPRCQWQKSICRSTYPEIELVGQSNHFAACHFVQEIGHKQ
ncbi:MAG: oligopeptide/dipeptide ABC transporter ATP-binding protein, partial [Lysobacterales bacterium]